MAALCFAASILCACFVQSCSTADYPAQTEAPGPGFYALFNGSDFTGWNTGREDGAWVVEDGLIHCKGEPRDPYLILTEKDYENIDFYAEFKVSKGCNSGIFYHVPRAGRESKLGFETQILDDAGKKPDKNATGSVYDVVPPILNAMKPAGVWNQYHVVFNWPLCRVWLNGHLVQDTDFSAHPELKYRMRTGPMGLSNHGYEVWYRNMWIKELPGKDAASAAFNGNDLSGWTVHGDADWRVEDGMIISSGGEGWLVSDLELDSVYFHAYVENDTLKTRDASINYRWKGADDPGYDVSVYDYIDAVKYTEPYGDKVPPDIVRPMKSSWFLYRIVSADRESRIYLNEFVISDNKLLGRDPRGRIAFYRSADDGVIRIKEAVLRKLEGNGI